MREFRLLLIIAFWPIHDLFLAKFVSLWLLSRVEPLLAAILVGLAVAMISCPLFLFLLSREEIWHHEWVKEQLLSHQVDGSRHRSSISRFVRSLASSMLSWVERQHENSERKRERTAAQRFGGPVGVVVVSLLSGGMAGVFTGRLLGYRGLKAYLLAAIPGSANAALWTALYGSGFVLFRLLLKLLGSA